MIELSRNLIKSINNEKATLLMTRAIARLLLKISIGVTSVDTVYSVEEIIVSTMDGIEMAHATKEIDYLVSLRS